MIAIKGSSLRKPSASLPLSVLLVTCGIVGTTVFFRSAWEGTALREAYLPELTERAGREPTNGPLLAALAVRLCEAKQYRMAAHRWEQAANTGERSAPLWRTWAASAAATGDLVKAQAILKIGILRSPDATAELAAVLDNLGSVPESPAAAAQAIAPDGAATARNRYLRGSFLNAAFTAAGKRDPERSGFATREAWAAKEPENAAVQRLWGEALLKNERPSDAEAAFRKTLALRPDDSLLFAHLGDALRLQGRLADAGAAYQRSLKQESNNLPALLGFGRAMQDRNLIRPAVAIFEKATHYHPKDAEAWIGMGEAHFAQRINFSGAVRSFEMARALAPTRTDFFTSYSGALRAAGRYQEAESVLNRRLTVAPDDARAHYLLALSFLDFEANSERRARAEQQLRLALRSEPNSGPVQGRLGQLLVETHRAAEAIPLLESALRSNNRHTPYLRSFAAALKQIGDDERARTVLASLADVTEYEAQLRKLEDRQMLHPDDLALHERMITLLDQGGEVEKAQFHREVVQMLRKHPEKAREALGQLNDAMSRITQ